MNEVCTPPSLERGLQAASTFERRVARQLNSRLTTFLAVIVVAVTATCSQAASLADENLSNWPTNAAPAEVGKRVAENVVARHFDFESNPKHLTVIYPEVIASYGALTVASLTHDSNLQTRLVQKFEPFLKPDGANRVSAESHVDFCVFGIVPFEIYIDTKDDRFLSWGKAFADRQWNQTTPDGITSQARYWIDDMYMITALQTEAFRATGNSTYMDRAAKTMTAYIQRLQQTNGLFFHGTNAPFYWSRGNGWVAAGMAELLRAMPENHPDRAAVMGAYRKMMAALLKYQGDDGLWHQLMDDPTAWSETSGSGMFAFALVTGVKSGWLDANTYGSAARKAWLGLVQHLNPDGNIRDVCVGTNKGNSREFYLQRPRSTGDLHGEAPVLWTASALLR